MKKQTEKLVLAISAGVCHGKTLSAKHLIRLFYNDPAWKVYRIYQVRKGKLDPVVDLANFNVDNYLSRQGDCFVLFARKGEDSPVLAINTMGDKWCDLLEHFYYKVVLPLTDIRVIVGACHSSFTAKGVLCHLKDIAQRIDAKLITTSPYYKMYPELPHTGHKGPVPNDVVALNELYAEQQKAFYERYV